MVSTIKIILIGGEENEFRYWIWTYYNDWDVLVDGSNSSKYCGLDNWRVPTIKELENITSVPTF